MNLTYEIIKKATKGCGISQQKILDNYDKYINALATIDSEQSGGNNKRLDKDLKAHIQCKLIEAIKKWKELI